MCEVNEKIMNECADLLSLLSLDNDNVIIVVSSLFPYFNILQEIQNLYNSYYMTSKLLFLNDESFAYSDISKHHCLKIIFKNADLPFVYRIAHFLSIKYSSCVYESTKNSLCFYISSI